METVVVFRVADQTLALPVDHVQRVLWAVEITALPGQDERMLGMINVEGTIIPVINLRNLLGQANRELDLDDHIITMEEGDRRLAFVVDNVEGVLHYEPQQLSDLAKTENEFASSVIKVDGALIVILKPAQLLSVAGGSSSSTYSRPLAAGVH